MVNNQCELQSCLLGPDCRMAGSRTLHAGRQEVNHSFGVRNRPTSCDRDPGEYLTLATAADWRPPRATFAWELLFSRLNRSSRTPPRLSVEPPNSIRSL